MSLEGLRSEFPALVPREGVRPPVYLDSACMSLVPRPVIAAMEEYYREYPGCAGRSVHRFAEEVSQRFEAARDGFAQFLGAPDRAAVVFVRNATEAINLVGQGLSWKRGERVLVSDQEHNSNLVLWQRLAKERGIRLEVLSLQDDGSFPSDAYEEALERGIRLVSFFHTSNLDGRSLPAKEIVDRAHDHGALVLLDGAQSAAHRPVRLAELGADYYALSAHKMLGPTGVGVLAAQPQALGEVAPLMSGGETVEWTTLTDHALRPMPHRFEAGLQNYAGVLGAHAALRFLSAAGLEEISAHDLKLNERLTRALSGEPRLRILGPQAAGERPSIFAFALEGIDPNDAALFLDEGYGVMVRSGRHCVHSWYESRGLSGNVRASLYLYNSVADVDALVAGVRELIERIPAGPSPPSAPERPANEAATSARNSGGAARRPRRR
ncbi:MAG: cysteine desulfurase [Thermoplasmata archaeon]|nr:cysteine desulfurase [Thermoplasmata archaeon]